MSKTRAHPRVELTLRVNCVLEDTFFTDYSRNLSEGGICLESLVPIDAGSEVQLQFSLPGSRKGTYSLNGRVVWVDQKPVDAKPVTIRPVGIQFQPDETHGQFRAEFTQTFLRGNAETEE